MADESKFGDLWENIKYEWGNVSDKSKDSWDNIVEEVTNKYREGVDWSDDKIHEAKGYFKGKFDKD